MKTSLLFALALAATASLAQAQRVWDGNTSGVWTDATNWDGDTTTPAANSNLNFGSANTFSITNRPGRDFGTWTFLSTADSYNIAGGGGRTNVIVEGSASATNHTIVNQVRLDGRSIDVQSTSTSLTLNDFDGGGANATFTKNGVGTLIATNSPNNFGIIQMNAGTLDLRGGTSSGNFGNGNLRLSSTNTAAVVTNSTLTRRTLAFSNQNSTTSAAATYAGQITGNFNVSMGRPNSGDAGSTQTLSGTNTYVGTTTINQGTILMNGTHTGGGNYAINSRNAATALGGAGFDDGTLGGLGTIVLADNTQTFSFTGVDANKNAILRPGGSGTDTATLTLGSSTIATTVDLNAFSVFRLDIGTSGASDRLAIFGDLNIASGSMLDLLSLSGAFDGPTYTLATFTGTRTGTFGTVTGLQNGYEIVYGTNSITAVIPEPSAALMLLGGIGVLVLRRRRLS